MSQSSGDKPAIRLGLFLRPTGHHVAGWRHPDATADAGRNFAHFVEMAKLAEAGLFDLLFCADIATLWSGDNDSLCRLGTIARIEPYTLLSGLAAVTRNIGVVCTASTTYDEPFHVARRFASLDLVSGGRAGWNLVTSAHEQEAQNFGRDEHMPKHDRYRRAREFADVVTGLWDTWDADAFAYDKQSGLYFDPEKLHTLNHVGQHFRVRGPLNVPPSPQGRPVMVQAGASDDGRDLAAATAEVVFTAQTTIEDACAFYADVKRRMLAHGRDPFELMVMPGLVVFVAVTREEAQAKHDALQDLIHPTVGLKMLSHYVGYDLMDCDVDGPLPEIPHSKIGNVSRTELLSDLARREKLTVRDLYKRVAGGRGHYQVIGTPADVADLIETWVDERACDGFNIMPPYFPGALQDFVDLVIPELQRRGRFRTRYEADTLRGNLGLPCPPSRWYGDRRRRNSG